MARKPTKAAGKKTGKGTSRTKKSPPTKSRKAAWVPPPLAERRGVITFDSNESLVLVKADVEATAGALKKHLGARTWIKNANGQEVGIETTAYVVYQMTGHPYSTIFLAANQPGTLQLPDGNLAQALSKALKVKAVYFGNSDTGGVTAFEAYEKGKQLERFYVESGVEFASTLRDESEAPRGGPDILRFVDKLMREHDAFAPGFTGSLMSYSFEPQKRKILDVSARSMQLDIEYAEPLPEPVFARVDYVAV